MVKNDLYALGVFYSTPTKLLLIFNVYFPHVGLHASKKGGFNILEGTQSSVWNAFPLQTFINIAFSII